jgi:hypothetical protein
MLSVKPPIDFFVMQGSLDRLDDNVGLRQHIAVPEAKHPVSIRSHEVVAMLIVGYLLCMLASIQLDNDRGLETDEITDVRAERPLSPEFESAQSASAQMIPKTLFGFRQVFAERAGKAIHSLN